MRTRVLLKVAALAGILALTGCAAKVAQPDQYSGFLKDYSSLKETTSASGKQTALDRSELQSGQL